MADILPDPSDAHRTPAAAGFRLRTMAPVPGARDVARPRLQASVAAGSADDRLVTIVSAPPGFGKTTMVAAWCAAAGRPTAWLTLTPLDDHPARLTEALAATIAPVASLAGATMASLALEVASGAALGRSLAADVAAHPGPWTLVLDDLHEIRNEEALAVIAALLDAAPRGLHVVLIGRDVPARALPTGDTARRLTLIDASDLRFQRDEAARLATTLGVADAGARFEECLRLSAGWPAFLRLMLQADSAFPLMVTGGPLDEVARLLVDGVLQQASPVVRDRLIRGSVAETICDSLLDALTGAPIADPAVRIGAWAANQGLVTAVGDDGVWWRVHPIARWTLTRWLEERDGVAAVGEAHARAAAWFAQTGLVAEAVEHALAGGEFGPASSLVAQQASAEDAAVEIVAAAGFAALGRERWGELDGLLARLPAEVVQRRAALMVLRCWREYHLPTAAQEMHYAHARSLLAGAERATLDGLGRERLLAHLDVLETFRLGAVLPAAEMFARAEEIAGRLGDGDGPARGIVRGVSGLAVALEQDFATGVGYLDARLAASVDAPTPAEQVSLLGALVLTMDLSRRGSERLPQVQRRMLEVATANDLPGARAMAATSLAWQALASWDLPQAQEYFAAGPRGQDQVPLNIWRRHQFGVAMLAAVSGDAPRANRITDAVVRLLEGTSHREWLHNSESFRARLWLLQGRHEDVAAWLGTLPDDAANESPLHGESLVITRIRALLARPGAADDPAIGAALAQAEAIAASGSLRAMAEAAGICRALWLDRQGRRRRALAVVTPVARATAARGDVLALAEFGGRVGGMLEAIAPREGIDPAYVAQVQEATSTLMDAYPDPFDLTARERAVLVALTEVDTLADVAQRLELSPHTARSHASRAYHKLGVTRRRDAIERARRLGLLPAGDEPDGQTRVAPGSERAGG